jgi:hypothetical protein
LAFGTVTQLTGLCPKLGRAGIITTHGPETQSLSVHQAAKAAASASEQLFFIPRLLRFNHSDFVDGVLQDRGFDVAERRYLPRSFIGGFLNHMTNVALRPAPFDLMSFGGFVQAFPPIVIRFAAKTAAHRLDHVL